VDARSRQPELKHAAVRVERAEFGWHLLAARRGDVLAMRAAVQPLLKDCGYAGVSLQVDAAAAQGIAWLVLRVAAVEAMPAAWLAALDQALALAAGADTLEYRDVRRGLLKRVAWRSETTGSHIDGLLLTDTQPVAGSLLRTALAGAAWQGPRLAAFSALAEVTRDPLVCVCRQVTESAIRAEVHNGADVPALKQRLGCGTVCGSCIPQLNRLARQAASA
jgi:assimilatory nitrate reductase catalytic subunit